MGVKVKEKVQGSGVYWVFINHNGRRSSKRVGSEKAAQTVREMIEAKIKLGQAFLPEQPKTVPTLEEYFKRFDRTHIETALRPSTQRNYRGAFANHILPAIGKLRLNEINRATLKNLVADLLAKGLAKDSIRLILAPLRGLFNDAKEDNGLLIENPAERLGKHYQRAKVVHDEIDPLTTEEVPRFFTAALESCPRHYPLLLCAVHTGLRSGELAGLQWGDVDFNGKFMTVRRGIVSGRVHPTKTGKIRRVDLSDALIVTLLELRRQQKERWLAKGQNDIPEWVFCNGEGKPCDMQNLKGRFFFRCLERAGIRRIRFHDLRHTFASLLIQNGESLAYVKEQMGHSSIKTTVDIYGHLVPGANRQAVNRLPSLKNLETKVETISAG